MSDFINRIDAEIDADFAKFKTRRAKAEARVEEALQARRTVTIHLGPIPPRHPATTIGE